MKSGYGVKTNVSATLSINAPSGHYAYTQTAFSIFPEFQCQTRLRLLEKTSSGRGTQFAFKVMDEAKDSPELQFVKVLSVTDSKGVNVDNAKELTEEEGEEKQQSAAITVLASPEQTKIITALENDGMAHVALISRGNKKLADELLAAQDTALTELYHPELLRRVMCWPRTQKMNPHRFPRRPRKMRPRNNKRTPATEPVFFEIR